VLEFDASPELLLAHGSHRDVRVTTKAPLLEVPVVDAGGDQDLPERLHISDSFCARTQIGVANNLNERGPGAIQVDGGVVADTMHVLPRVFLHVDTRDPCALELTAEFVLEVPRGAIGTIELADLVAFGEVRIEVVLPGEDALGSYREPQRERRPYR